MKVWVAIYLASPVPDDKGKFRYDSVKASYKFFCKSRQQLLIQGTYSLGRSRVYERLSNESMIEEIEPNTLASTILDDFCDPTGRTLAPRGAPPNSASTDFVCPENLPSDAARQAELQRFLHRMAAEHPEMDTTRQIINMRVKVLEAHHCTQTLNNLRRGEE